MHGRDDIGTTAKGQRRGQERLGCLHAALSFGLADQLVGIDLSGGEARARGGARRRTGPCRGAAVLAPGPPLEPLLGAAVALLGPVLAGRWSRVPVVFSLVPIDRSIGVAQTRGLFTLSRLLSPSHYRFTGDFAEFCRLRASANRDRCRLPRVTRSRQLRCAGCRWGTVVLPRAVRGFGWERRSSLRVVRRLLCAQRNAGRSSAMEAREVVGKYRIARKLGQGAWAVC